jgi:hypothetical protein
MNALIENGEIKGHHRRPLAEIIAQTYKLQLESCTTQQYRSVNKENLAAAKARVFAFKKQNTVYKNAFLDLLKPKNTKHKDSAT